MRYLVLIKVFFHLGEVCEFGREQWKRVSIHLSLCVCVCVKILQLCI